MMAKIVQGEDCKNWVREGTLGMEKIHFGGKMSKLILISIVTGLALSLLACGAAVGLTTDLNVDMVEYMFDPGTFIIPSGEQITLHLSNNGSLVHEFVIMDYGTNVGTSFGAEDEPNIFWGAELQPGNADVLTFVAPGKPGEYQVVCGTKGHFETGMLGTLTVVDAP
jgi:uncharacterized cupredoxin-like copper-binding protein